jgi:polyisoprenyl-teichoic acid--peptidoglycan teichoic acid transferase
VTPGDGATPPVQRGSIARFVAGFASAIVPGLGHLIIGRPRRAAMFFAPLLVFLVLVAIYLATQGAIEAAATLVDPTVIGVVLVAQGLFLIWRLLAVGSAMTDRTFGRLRPLDVASIVVVLAIVVLPQVGLGYVTNTARLASAEIFQPSVDNAFPSEEPIATELPSAGSPDGSSVDPFSPSASASPSGTPTTPRVTVLLLGVDQGAGRNTFNTDTMIVASLDPVAGTVSMASIPRDMVDAPLPKGRTYSGKVNGLVSYVRWHADQFPGYKGNGQAVLAYALGKMLGVHIDYYAQVNLPGMVQVVNAVGGIDVMVDHALCDARYDEYGYQGYSIGAGRHHMGGNAALAYARIRKSVGESDFTRAARQQQVVVALKDRVVHGGFLDDPIGLIRSIGDTVETNVPPSVVRNLAPLATTIGAKDIYRVIVGHPYVRPGYDARGSIQLPDLKKIATLGAALFTPPGTLPATRYLAPAPTKVAKGAAQPAPRCSVVRSTPRPTAKPTPKPTKKPTPAPTPSATPTPTEAPTPEPTPEPTPAPT